MSKKRSRHYLFAIFTCFSLALCFHIINKTAFVKESDVESHFSFIKIQDVDSTLPEIQDTNLPEKKEKIIAPLAKPDAGTDLDTFVILINRADSLAWKKLRGIGTYRADRILRFRNALGGFASVDQVGETYGLPDSVFERIKTHLVLKHTDLRTMAINRISYDSLYLHPYITRQMAYFILKHRRENGPLVNLAALKEIIPEKDHQRLTKVEPYLDFGIYKD